MTSRGGEVELRLKTAEVVRMVTVSKSGSGGERREAGRDRNKFPPFLLEATDLQQNNVRTVTIRQFPALKTMETGFYDSGGESR